MDGNVLDLLIGTGKSIASTMAKAFATNVIEKWTKRRAENFFESFQYEIIKARSFEDSQDNLEFFLDQIISTELGSEILFDAYRRVSLSKSKMIGPRIIGLLTAELCLEGRLANETEELYFSVAETLSDSELLNVANTIEKWIFEAGKKDKEHIYNSNGFTCYVLERYESDMSSGISSKVDIFLSNLDEYFGVGFEKFKNIGLLMPSISQSSVHLSEDSERYIDYDMVVQVVEKKLFFPLKYRRINALISRMSEGVSVDS